MFCFGEWFGAVVFLLASFSRICFINTKVTRLSLFSCSRYYPDDTCDASNVFENTIYQTDACFGYGTGATSMSLMYTHNATMLQYENSTTCNNIPTVSLSIPLDSCIGGDGTFVEYTIVNEMNSGSMGHTVTNFSIILVLLVTVMGMLFSFVLFCSVKCVTTLQLSRRKSDLLLQWLTME